MAEKSRVQCLDRALNILEALARKQSMSVTDLASEVGLHVSTVHNILTVLAGRGYLLNEGGRYRCGPALLALASSSDPLSNISHVAKPHLEQITRRTGESAVVGVLSASGVTMLAATASTDGLSCPAVNQVFQRPLVLATGRLLVSCGPDENWDRQITELREGMSAPNDVDSKSSEQWRHTFAGIRQAGSCVVRVGRDSGSVAVAVRDARGVVVAALGANSIGRLADEEHWDRLRAEVEQAGRRVSAGLGFAVTPAESGQ